MRYKVTLRDVAAEDFGVLDGDVQRQAIKQLNKLKQSPELGSDLGHKMGVDLSGYRSLHFYKNQYRIVYKVLEDQKEVEVWGIAKREAGAVYKMVSKRIEQEH
jgi:mRNA-degrading endonuclease RelE of RelBE toxin-antitoxin system